MHIDINTTEQNLQRIDYIIPNRLSSEMSISNYLRDSKESTMKRKLELDAIKNSIEFKDYEANKILLKEGSRKDIKEMQENIDLDMVNYTNKSKEIIETT